MMFKCRICDQVFESVCKKNEKEMEEDKNFLYRENKRLEQIELINDILDAREAHAPKKVEYKTILRREEFDALKKRIRKEIVDECRADISDIIYEGQRCNENIFDRQKAMTRIIEIIKG